MRILLGSYGKDVELAWTNRGRRGHAVHVFAGLQGNIRVEYVGVDRIWPSTCVVAIGHGCRYAVAIRRRGRIGVERPIAKAQREGLGRAIGVGDSRRPSRWTP